MDSQARDFELGLDIGVLPIETTPVTPTMTGVPLRCHRPMRTATLVVATPVSLFGTMLMALLALPRGAVRAPARLRARSHRRA